MLKVRVMGINVVANPVAPVPGIPTPGETPPIFNVSFKPIIEDGTDWAAMNTPEGTFVLPFAADPKLQIFGDYEFSIKPVAKSG